MMRELFLRDLSLWECLWQSVVFLALGLAAARLLRRRPSRAYAALLVAMMAAALVPFLSAVVRHGHLGAFPAAPEESVPVLAYASRLSQGRKCTPGPGRRFPARHQHRTGIESLGSASIPWQVLLLSAWLAATLLLIARLVAMFVYGLAWYDRPITRGARRFNRPPNARPPGCGLAHGLQIRASDRIRSPVVWCWTRPPVLLVPRALGRPGRRVDGRRSP